MTTEEKESYAEGLQMEALITFIMGAEEITEYEDPLIWPAQRVVIKDCKGNQVELLRSGIAAQVDRIGYALALWKVNETFNHKPIFPQGHFKSALFRYYSQYMNNPGSI